MSKTILVADDSVTIQKVVELTFIEEDFHIVTAGNGDEAFARLDEIVPDLVIADVHMPGADGYEVCRRVKQRHPGVPVLLLIGTFEPFNPEEAAAAGADGELKKPFDSQALLNMVNEMMLSSPAASEEAGTKAIADEPAEPFGELSVSPLEASPALVDVPAMIEEATDSGTAQPFSKSVVDVMSEPEEESPVVEPADVVSVPQPEANGDEGSSEVSEEMIERIAARVVEMISAKAIQEVAWEVVPDLAEVVIKDRLRELENEID